MVVTVRTRLRLIFSLVAGALLGSGAGLTANRYLQITLVCLAALVGIYTGWSIRRTRNLR